MTNQIDWRKTDQGDVPVSRQFDDPYYSLDNGAAETRHVFLGGNDLPARFRDCFHIAELGFGTGLNFCVALQAFRNASIAGKLYFTSFEAFPLTPADRQRALSGLSDLPTHLAGMECPQGDDFVLRIIEGDARDTLPLWETKADAWFLDGFSPTKNPELWGDRLMQSVAAHTSPDGTIATYTAAGHVRRSLDAAGFNIERVAGFGRKRHMTRGVLR